MTFSFDSESEKIRRFFAAASEKINKIRRFSQKCDGEHCPLALFFIQFIEPTKRTERVVIHSKVAAALLPRAGRSDPPPNPSLHSRF